jgi:hypothetical protein
MPWLAAELVLFNLDEDAPPAFKFWIAPANVGGRRVTREANESGSMHRSGSAAFYRTPDEDIESSRAGNLKPIRK